MALELENKVRSIAKDLGFDECRFSLAKEASHANQFQDWLDEGKNGDMKWMERSPERRKDPRHLLKEAKTVIVLAINYYPSRSDPRSSDKLGRFAKYAWGEDYHLVVDKKLKAFSAALKDLGGEQRFYVDYGPILERDFATDSGLGWNGKSTVQIHQSLGTWFFLAELVTTLNLISDEPVPNRCGKCTQCIDICPTEAITSPHHLDARRCISYLTIEHKGSIPQEYRKAIGDRIFGCDDCLEVCPWNRFAKASNEVKFTARDYIDMSLNDFLKLSEENFRSIFSRSPVKRIGRDRFLRNVCIALGNIGDISDIQCLERVAAEENQLVSEHAKWAIEQINSRS
ncbi:MAG: tRNA epoxyqueuosine(34) reductase QueG [Verrucomicrobiota bacterium]|nr:tRNA epoxyqueuosine(34) reductase QueG [Verrucomicrobiota bacterium]MEE2966557.1 tRNA epoxyqueuosine(34) reductase QueG [Verrucomicrobiota bacterium]